MKKALKISFKDETPIVIFVNKYISKTTQLEFFGILII